MYVDPRDKRFSSLLKFATCHAEAECARVVGAKALVARCTSSPKASTQAVDVCHSLVDDLHLDCWVSSLPLVVHHQHCHLALVDLCKVSCSVNGLQTKCDGRQQAQLVGSSPNLFVTMVYHFELRDEVVG